MSTSLLVSKMRAQAEKYEFRSLLKHFRKHWLVKKVRMRCRVIRAADCLYVARNPAFVPNKPVEVIDSLLYGKVDGLGCLRLRLQRLKKPQQINLF